MGIFSLQELILFYVNMEIKYNLVFLVLTRVILDKPKEIEVASLQLSYVKFGCL